jgi:hypothetical protein
VSAEAGGTAATAGRGLPGTLRPSGAGATVAAPAEAATTQQTPIHSAADNRWPRAAKPISAATAGWTDIQTPNRLVGMRRSASSSNQ